MSDSDWKSVDVTLFQLPWTRAPERKFSARLPPGWVIDGLRMGADSWGGAFIGPEFTLRIQGGPHAVNILYAIVGSGPLEFDRERAAQHTIAAEHIGGIPAKLVRPRDGVNGTTGIIFSMPGEDVIITGKGLSRKQQAVAFAIFRSIRP